MLNLKAFPTAGFLITTLLRTALVTSVFFLFTSFVASAQTGTGAKKLDPNKKQIVASDKQVVTQVPASTCNYSKNQVDKEKGTVVKMMEREKLIVYTPDEMKEIFPDSDYLTMEAYLNNFNNTIALLLKITIQTNNPQDTYGAIYKEHKLLLKLSNGETVTLYSGQSDAGNVDLTHIRTSYMTFYQLDDATLDKLKTAHVVKARLFWEKGYEDYTINTPDFFIRQIACVR